MKDKRQGQNNKSAGRAGSHKGKQRSTAPGSTAPGSTAPGSTAPGSTAPGSTASGKKGGNKQVPPIAARQELEDERAGSAERAGAGQANQGNPTETSSSVALERHGLGAAPEPQAGHELAAHEVAANATRSAVAPSVGDEQTLSPRPRRHSDVQVRSGIENLELGTEAAAAEGTEAAAAEGLDPGFLDPGLNSAASGAAASGAAASAAAQSGPALQVSTGAYLSGEGLFSPATTTEFGERDLSGGHDFAREHGFDREQVSEAERILTSPHADERPAAELPAGELSAAGERRPEGPHAGERAVAEAPLFPIPSGSRSFGIATEGTDPGKDTSAGADHVLTSARDALLRPDPNNDDEVTTTFGSSGFGNRGFGNPQSVSDPGFASATEAAGHRPASGAPNATLGTPISEPPARARRTSPPIPPPGLVPPGYSARQGASGAYARPRRESLSGVPVPSSSARSSSLPPPLPVIAASEQAPAAHLPPATLPPATLPPATLPPAMASSRLPSSLSLPPLPPRTSMRAPTLPPPPMSRRPLPPPLASNLPGVVANPQSALVYAAPTAPPAPHRQSSPPVNAPGLAAQRPGLPVNRQSEEDDDEVTHVFHEPASDGVALAHPQVSRLPGPPALSSRKTLPPMRAVMSAPPPGVAFPTRPPIPATQRKRPTSAVRKWAAGALAVAAAVAALIFFVTPRHGGIVVTVAGPGNLPVDGVKVFVDGVERCGNSPCSISGLKPGTHMVRSTAGGFEPTAEQAIIVRRGQDSAHNFVLNGANAVRAGIRVPRGSEEGVAADPIQVFVDGAPHGQLPLDLSGLEPASYLLRFEGNARFEPEERRVTLGPGQTLELDPVLLRVKRGQLKLSLHESAKGARVLVDGKPVRKFPAKLELAGGEPHTIVATRRGYEPFRQQLRFEPGKPEQELELRLLPEEATENAAAVPAAPAPVEIAAAASARVKPAVTAAAVAPVAATGAATLNLNSIPATTALVNGQAVGRTPRLGVKVRSGTQTVVFVHPERGRKQIRVMVSPGETKTVAVRF